MAQMISNGLLDFREFNIWAVIDQFSRFQFFNNLNPSIDGTEIPGYIGTYRAEDAAGWWNGPTSLWNAASNFIVAGESVVLNASQNAVSGWLTGMFYDQNVNGTSVQFTFGGFRVGAVAFQQVAMTRGNADDITLLKTALAGADRITGSAFADFVYGWTGDDKLFGNGGNDTLSGDAGADQIRGGSGNDLIKGGSGNDLLLGDAGNDRLDGGMGRDTLTGGLGADRFIFVEGQLAGDRVTDFQNNLDTLVLDAAGTGFTVAQALAAAVNISGGVRFDLGGGNLLTVMGVTKAQLADDIVII